MCIRDRQQSAGHGDAVAERVVHLRQQRGPPGVDVVEQQQFPRRPIGAHRSTEELADDRVGAVPVTQLATPQVIADVDLSVVNPLWSTTAAQRQTPGEQRQFRRALVDSPGDAFAPVMRGLSRAFQRQDRAGLLRDGGSRGVHEEGVLRSQRATAVVARQPGQRGHLLGEVGGQAVLERLVFPLRELVRLGGPPAQRLGQIALPTAQLGQPGLGHQLGVRAPVPGDRLEHQHRPPAGKCLQGRGPTGIGHHDVRARHQAGHVIHPTQRDDPVVRAVGEAVAQRGIPAADDDNAIDAVGAQRGIHRALNGAEPERAARDQHRETGFRQPERPSQRGPVGRLERRDHRRHADRAHGVRLGAPHRPQAGFAHHVVQVDLRVDPERMRREVRNDRGHRHVQPAPAAQPVEAGGAQRVGRDDQVGVLLGDGPVQQPPAPGADEPAGGVGEPAVAPQRVVEEVVEPRRGFDVGDVDPVERRGHPSAHPAQGVQPGHLASGPHPPGRLLDGAGGRIVPLADGGADQ